MAVTVPTRPHHIPATNIKKAMKPPEAQTDALSLSFATADKMVPFQINDIKALLETKTKQARAPTARNRNMVPKLTSSQIGYANKAQMTIKRTTNMASKTGELQSFELIIDLV